MKNTKLFATAFVVTFATAISSIHPTFASRIERATGPVELKRRGEEKFNPTGVGEEVGLGDGLRVGRGAEVELVCCNNGNSETLYFSGGKTEPVKELCPGSPPVNRTRFNNQNRPGGNNPQLPYVISPRMTYLLTDKPTLRWNKVEGATSYTVRVETEDGEFRWEIIVSSTEVDYPDHAPSLEWGEKYLVTVEASFEDSNDAFSQSDLGANLGFEILDEPSIQKIEEAQTRITQNSAGKYRAIALADLYQRQGLITNAIETLKNNADKGSQNPLIYMRLGDLYGFSGLNLLAEASYDTKSAFKSTTSKFAQAFNTRGFGRYE